MSISYAEEVQSDDRPLIKTKNIVKSYIIILDYQLISLKSEMVVQYVFLSLQCICTRLVMLSIKKL